MTNTVTVVVPADLISVNNNSLTLTLHLSLEENAASNTDHRYSFTYLWREQGRHHRPSVQFYLPMKVVKRVRQATQTIGTVLPTHEENEAGNTDYGYSFTYPWREWGRQHRLSVQFYLPMKRMRQATQTIGTVLPTHESREENEGNTADYGYSFTYPRKSRSYFSCFWISLTTTSLSGNFSLWGGPFFSPVQSTTDSEQCKHRTTVFIIHDR